MQIPDQTPSQQPVCLRCGRCCRYGPSIHATPEDLTRWIFERRSDILCFFEAYCTDGTYINCTTIPDPEFISHILWTDMINPDTGDYYTDCPFLIPAEGNTWSCTIHQTRPAICVRFRPWEWGEKGKFFSCPQAEGAGKVPLGNSRTGSEHPEKDESADHTDQS